VLHNGNSRCRQNSIVVKSHLPPGCAPESSQAHSITNTRDLLDRAKDASSHGAGHSMQLGNGFRSMHMPNERVSSGGGRFEKLVYPVPWRLSEEKVYGKLNGATRFDPRQIRHKKIGFPIASNIASV